MTRKDYELIANAVNDAWKNHGSAIDVAGTLAKALAADNPRFDRNRFMEACTK